MHAVDRVAAISHGRNRTGDEGGPRRRAGKRVSGRGIDDGFAGQLRGRCPNLAVVGWDCRDPTLAVDCDRKAETVRVVGVFADEIHASGSTN